MSDKNFIRLEFEEKDPETMRRDSAEFAAEFTRRRSVRHFSDRPVPRDVIENCLRAAGAAPSGANRQPWYFVAITDADLKKKIRNAAELEEHEFYARRAPQEWLDVLKPLGTDENKPFLETAPYLIVVFEQRYEKLPNGERRKNYYTQESVGLATGALLAAIHHAGLASLTHTPSPMGFLNEVLDRPANERPFLIIVVGYPADGAQVPNIQRKSLDDIAEFR